MDVSSSFLQSVLDDTRLYIDEPAINAKYSDTQILRIMQSIWATLLADLNRNSSAPVILRHSFSVTSGTEFVLLPPTISQILRIVSYDTNNAVQSDLIPRSMWNGAGPGFTIEGNTLRFTPKWTGADTTFHIHYIPSGSVSYHSGTASTITNSTTADTCTVILAATPTLGSLDNRPNSYGGCIFRVLTATTHNFVQDRIIRSYDVTTRTVTLYPSFETDLLPGGATVTYEIVPLLANIFDNLIALAICRHIAAIEGDNGRLKTLTQLYAEQMRSNRLGAANVQSIIDSRFETDTIFNERNYGWV
jgi:hypothetical protein